MRPILLSLTLFALLSRFSPDGRQLALLSNRGRPDEGDRVKVRVRDEWYGRYLR